MDSDLCETLADIQASCKHDIVDQMIQVQNHYQLSDLKSVEWARNLSCLRRLSRKRRRGAYEEEDGGEWFSTTLGRGSTNGHSDYVAVSYPWKPAVATALCDTATGRTTASTNCDSARAGGWKIQTLGNPRALERSKVRDGVLSRAVAYAESHGTELVWIDRECVPQDEEERPHLHETAMQSMDLVYRWAKHPLALIFEGVWSQDEVDLLEKLLRGQIVEVSSFDGDYTAPPSDGEKKGDDEEVDPLTDYPRFHADTDQSLITQVLLLLTRLTSDPWFSRAWIFQENYCAGAKMRLLIPHARNISKAHAVDLFGSIPHELNIRSIAFFNAATKFCLAYLADARYAHSTAGAAACEAIIHRAGRYNLLHRYGFVSSTGSTSPTEIRVQAEAEKHRRRRHHRSHKSGMKTASSRPFSRAMSTTIFADLAARRITQPHDILAIAANCCAYDVRLDTKALRSAGTVAKAAETLAELSGDAEKDGRRRKKSIDSVYESLSAAVLALWFLNGEVFKNMLPPPPEPLLPAQYPDMTISPDEGQGGKEKGKGDCSEGRMKSPPKDDDEPKNNDFDTSDAPLSLTLSTTLSPVSAPGPTTTTIPPITPPPAQGTALSFLSTTALDSFIPPPPSSNAFRAGPLTFLKSCRFRDVQLCHAGVGTRGHMWVLDERIASREWNGPVARRNAGGKWWRRRKSRVDPLALLAEELRTRGNSAEGEGGGRYRWLAARLDTMVAVRVEERQKREDKRDRRRRAKQMGVSVRVVGLRGTTAKKSTAASSPVTTSATKGPRAKNWTKPRLDEAALNCLRESVTTFDRCMADAVAEAIRDGRDLILARLWDGAEDPSAEKDDDEVEERGHSLMGKKIYRGVFVWDESPQGEDVAGPATSDESSGGEEAKVAGGSGGEGPTEAKENSTDANAKKEKDREEAAEDWSDILDSDSDSESDSDTPPSTSTNAKHRLPSRTKPQHTNDKATETHSSLPSPSSSDSDSSKTINKDDEAQRHQQPTAPFKPTLVFTSHTPHNTRYRFDRRAALEESRIDKFVSLEVALDCACPPPSSSSPSVEEKSKERDCNRKSPDERESGAQAVNAPPVLRTKRWINGLGFLPSAQAFGRQRDIATAMGVTHKKSASAVAAEATGKSKKGSKAKAKVKGKMITKAKPKPKAKAIVAQFRSSDSSSRMWTRARMRLRASGGDLTDGHGGEVLDVDEDEGIKRKSKSKNDAGEDSDESWEEDDDLPSSSSSSSSSSENEEDREEGKKHSTAPASRKSRRGLSGKVTRQKLIVGDSNEGRGADEVDREDGEGERQEEDEGEHDFDCATGERRVVFAWPEGMVRR
ncbi:uncharacterized protein J3D65DRAFT_377243 [Phyllosticta citribraziliensis]|uniref:Heterokaryon incompatibility domain-containing protein n=1 Tax=Phyllosticta citribraziliensis TaxID=989973 RepID=A0ABR1LRN2_9PEZI